MPEQSKAPEPQSVPVLSGTQVVQDFLDSIVNDPNLDSPTVTAIQQLYHDDKLSHINLLRKLQDARKETNA